MTVVGKSILKDLVQKYQAISPASDGQFDGDGYVLTVREDTTLNYLEHRNLISNEVIFTPPSFVAHLTAKSKFGRLGLSFLNAAKVHSFFVGRLALELVNLSNERTPITIRRGDPLIHVEFLRREGDPSPYLGRYMFQYMDDEEVDKYIVVIGEHFNDICSREQLRTLKENRVKPGTEI
jgi:dCTP deaminase